MIKTVFVVFQILLSVKISKDCFQDSKLLRRKIAVDEVFDPTPILAECLRLLFVTYEVYEVIVVHEEGRYRPSLILTSLAVTSEAVVDGGGGRDLRT